MSCVSEPVVASGSSGIEFLYLLTGDSRVTRGGSRRMQEVKLGHDGKD